MAVIDRKLNIKFLLPTPHIKLGGGDVGYCNNHYKVDIHVIVFSMIILNCQSRDY